MTAASPANAASPHPDPSMTGNASSHNPMSSRSEPDLGTSSPGGRRNSASYLRRGGPTNYLRTQSAPSVDMYRAIRQSLLPIPERRPGPSTPRSADAAPTSAPARTAPVVVRRPHHHYAAAISLTGLYLGLCYVVVMLTKPGPRWARIMNYVDPSQGGIDKYGRRYQTDGNGQVIPLRDYDRAVEQATFLLLVLAGAFVAWGRRERAD